MKYTDNKIPLVTHSSLHDYFQESLNSAIEHQHQSFAPETIFYITNLLMQFNDSEQVFEETEDGRQIIPLAFIYQRAVEASNRSERDTSLKYLGDISLFISGLYPQSLSRSLVDVDYYISMGENAYSSLANIPGYNDQALTFHLIYDELSKKFLAVVDILQEVASEMHTHDDNDIMRLYEIWLKTQSKFAEQKLRSLGIEPLDNTNNRFH